MFINCSRKLCVDILSSKNETSATTLIHFWNVTECAEQLFKSSDKMPYPASLQHASYPISSKLRFTLLIHFWRSLTVGPFRWFEQWTWYWWFYFFSDLSDLITLVIRRCTILLILNLFYSLRLVRQFYFSESSFRGILVLHYVSQPFG